MVRKGQGNLASLYGVEGPRFFILRAKCEEVATELAIKAGDVLLVEATSTKKRQET